MLEACVGEEGMQGRCDGVSKSYTEWGGGTDHEKKKNMSSNKASWQSGETVMVRATHYKWLQGQVKRLARGGVAIWVEEAQLVVHVPLQLASSHLSTSSSRPLPPSASLLRLPTCQPDRCLVLAVRPAHLSHRPLFQRFLNKSTPTIDIHATLPLRPDHSAPPTPPPPPSTPPAAPPGSAVSAQNNQADHLSRNHPASQVYSFSPPEINHPMRPASHADDHSFPEQKSHGIPAVIVPALVNSPEDAQSVREELVSAPEKRPPNRSSSPGDQRPSHLTSGMHAEAPPAKAHFPDSPPLSPASTTSQRALKLLESIPESPDCHAVCEKPPLEEVAKTTSGRFSGPHLEVPHTYTADNCASSSSSSTSSTATTPSPGRQTLGDRIKKLKLPASEKTSPDSQPEKRSNSLHGSWITIIQDGSHEKRRRFPTT